MSKRKQLLTADEARPAVRQHKKPCSDCPWARTSLRGWLGGTRTEEWLADARNDVRIECHTRKGMECAGAAIYRRNTCKLVRPPLLVLEADRELVFANPMEFTEHHTIKKKANHDHEEQAEAEGEDTDAE